MWRIGYKSIEESGAGWFLAVVKATPDIATAAKYACKWQLKEQNVVVDYAHPTRAMTTLSKATTLTHVKQHLDSGDRVEGSAITWLVSRPRRGIPSVERGYFWMSSAGVRLHNESGRVVVLRATRVRHGTTAGAKFAHDKAVRIGMAFFANAHSVKVCNNAVEANPNVQAKSSAYGFETEKKPKRAKL